MTRDQTACDHLNLSSKYFEIQEKGVLRVLNTLFPENLAHKWGKDLSPFTVEEQQNKKPQSSPEGLHWYILRLCGGLHFRIRSTESGRPITILELSNLEYARLHQDEAEAHRSFGGGVP